MRRKEVIEQIGHVEAEWTAAARAVALLVERISIDPTALPPGVQRAALVRCKVSLEATYLIRLFAVFESALRGLWQHGYQKPTSPKAEDLINGCASRAKVPDHARQIVHAIREYRNFLVHGSQAPRVTLPQSRSGLAIFLGKLPAQW